MLQSKSFCSLYNQLSQESQDEVFSEILKTKSLMDVLKHPIIADGYRDALLKRHDYTNLTFLKHLISTSNNVDFLYELYVNFRWASSYNDVISDSMTEHSWKLCIKLPNKILLMSNWLYSQGHFDLSGYPEPVEFNFQRDIIDENIQESSIFILQCENIISNPEWNAHSPPDIPQCISIGQKEVTLFEHCFK